MANDSLIDFDSVHRDDPVRTPQQSLVDFDSLSGEVEKGIPQSQLPADALNRTIAGIGDLIGNAPTQVLNAGVGIHKGVSALSGKPDDSYFYALPNYAERGMSAAGMLADPSQLSTGQRFGESAISGAALGFLAPEAKLANMVAGAVSGPAGEGVQELTGDPVLSALVSMATAHGAGKLAPTSAQLVRQQAARDAVDAGLKVAPTDMGKGGLSRAAWTLPQSLAGKAALGQEFSAKNLEKFNDMARDDMGIGGHGQISEADLDQARQPHFDAYSDAAKTDPAIAQAVKEWRRVNDSIRTMKKTPAPWGVNKEETIADAHQQSESWLNWIDGAAQQMGNSGMADRLRNARKSLAQIGTYERAITAGDVSAAQIARDSARQFYAPDSGLAKIANFYDNFKKYAQPASQTAAHGTHLLTPALATVFGEHMGSTLGHEGIGSLIGMAGGVYGPAAARSALASAMVQRMASPSTYRSALAEQLQKINPNLQLLNQRQGDATQGN